MIFEEQIARKPNKYLWTQDFIEAIHSGFWTDKEFSFSSDVHDFNISLSNQEREIITRTLSAISQIEVAVKTFWGKLGENLPHPSLNDLGYVMANTEVIHNNAYERLLDVLGIEDIFRENMKLACIEGRVKYLKKYTHRFYKDSKKQYVYALILFTLFVENVSLFSQFYIILWFGRYKNVLKDTNQQVNYTKNEECYIDGTEILTNNGWIELKNISIGDLVYQYCEDGTFTLTNVLNKTENEFSGDLIQFSRCANQCVVTPNHDMVYFNNKGDFLRKKAIDLKLHKDVIIPIGGLLKNEGVESLSDEDRLRIAIQADFSNSYYKNSQGEKVLRGKDGGFTHSASLTKDRKKVRIRNILSILNVEYSESENQKNNKIKFNIKYNHDYDYKYFKWIDLTNKTSKWCEEFIEECALWDGFEYNESGLGYSSTIKENIDIVQTIAILAGYSTNIYRGNESSRKETYKDCYKLNMTKKNLKPISHGIKKEYVPYCGKVYCVTVNSGAIITRYKDKTFISGNCLHSKIGIQIIKTIKSEYPELFDSELEDKILHEANEAYLAECKIIDWIIGSYTGTRISGDILKGFIKSRINDSLSEIGYRKIFEVDQSIRRDFEWFDEEVIGNNATDFFNQRPVEYARVLIDENDLI